MSSNQQRWTVGVDIGGSHVTAAVFDVASRRLIDGSRIRAAVSSDGPAEGILAGWSQAIHRSVEASRSPRIGGIGVAMPGPFDYPRGICAIRGLQKYDSLFGLNVRQGLLDRLRLDEPPPIVFRNDAECFALGEAWQGAGRGAQKLVAITLGTGLGSAFVREGRTICHGADVPHEGWLYNQPFEGAIAEEHFSARGLLRRWKPSGGTTADTVAQLAERAAHDPAAAELFREFGHRLGQFLAPWLTRFASERAIIGGSIAQSWTLFGPSLNDSLRSVGACPAVQAELFEDAALYGAATLPDLITQSEQVDEPRLIREKRWRRSRQALLPPIKPAVGPGEYDLYPAFDVGEDTIGGGFDALAAALADQRTVIIDGYVGVFFDHFRSRLSGALRHLGRTPLWFESRVAFNPPAKVQQLVEPFVGGDDPLFGTPFTHGLEDFFDRSLLDSVRPDEAAGLSILIGPGAALAGWDGMLVYLDLPKNELQFRSRAGSVTNLAADAPAPAKQMYKRFYFVDWIALNRHKKALLPRVDLMVDTQRPEDPSFFAGARLRDALGQLSTGAWRVRPWFEPGPWGGQLLKENVPDLPREEPNYAWSFELIVPENGLLFQSGGRLLEISFDWLMFAHAQRIIGESHRFFGDEFPIRFDYLDTVRGGNLSVQCHPRTPYIRRNFGERFTQDETYYIHHAEPDARVYLGFREGIDPTEFREQLERSARDGSAVEIDRFVASWPAKKHDLFLIPNGTIHCSGIGNLVLEISATPYIFTFKMYDWLRLDLDGQPRSLNIARAFENLDFSRQGTRVAEELISQPRQLAHGDDWRIIHLPTHPEHFYDVLRCEFQTRINLPTNGSCHVGNLVEGREITVRSPSGTSTRVTYGETFVVPAAAEQYTLENDGGGTAQVVIAFVKERDWDQAM